MDGDGWWMAVMGSGWVVDEGGEIGDG